MAEYINKAEALDKLCRGCWCEDECNKKKCHDYRKLNNLPTIDVVRCSECKYAEPHEYFDIARNEKIYGVGCRRSGQHPADWFCADGERSE